ncbi:MAG TPA: sigma-54 dependent transcriptional regulator [Vicinamibacterales bacterium]|nr:sigma-54 dependent transcriptional regulator [Vicinamibacterales bacterium]
MSAANDRLNAAAAAPARGESGSGWGVGHELRQVLAALGAGLSREGGEPDLPGIFERELQRALAVRTVRLREIPPRYQARLVTPTRTPDSIVLGVPSSDPRVQAVLEASTGPDRCLDERDQALLSAAAELGGLVLEAARSRPRPRAATVPQTAPLVGSTQVMQSLRDRVERVAVTDFTVLVEGESGTGKELVARQLHDISRRRNGPFVAVNCAAVVETLLEAELFGIEERTATGVRGRRGKFEHADGGTLFLDEVSDLSLSAQAKLLRAIQDLAVERVGGVGSRRVNTRIVVATNRPLSEMVARAQFRADLYYRLSGVEIHVPPLRQRRDDIAELARYFLNRHRGTRELTLSVAAEDALRLYAWPGNVRELERLMERAVALTGCDRVELDDLPPHVRGDYGTVIGPALTTGASMRAWGSRYARLVFERCGHNKRQACRVLDISYHTLQAYLRYADRNVSMSPTSTPAWSTSGRSADDDSGNAP